MKSYEEVIQNPPVVFVSYSWSSDEHVKKVLHLSKRLRQDSIDVKIDRWDLKEGQDKYQFMEQMVNDESIEKVLLICDKIYMEKANGKKGGVGDETQIISPEIYQDVKQTKFIPIIFEKDEMGKPYLPTFIKGRIYIDLSAPDIEEEEYERLLRTIFDRPKNEREPLGTPPSYLFEDELKSITRTNSKIRRLKRALQNGETFAIGIFENYLNELISVLKNEFSIDKSEINQPFDEVVINRINDFLIYRDEYVEIINEIQKYNKDIDIFARAIHGFFENMLKMVNPKSNANNWDHYRFISWELFLYTTSLIIERRNFSAYSELTHKPYFISDQYGSELCDFGVFFHRFPSIDVDRKKRLNLNKKSLSMIEMKNRENEFISLNSLMQTDLILFLRSTKLGGQFSYWFPATLIYARHNSAYLEFFIRAEYKNEFDLLLTFIDHEDKDDLINTISTNSLRHHYFGPFFELGEIANIINLGSK